MPSRVPRGGEKTYPKDQLGILAMPAVARVMGKEAPGKPIVFVLHEDPDPASVARPPAHVLLPNYRQEEWTRRVHNRNVWQQPVSVIRLQRFDHPEKERMLGHCAHCIV